MSNHVKISNEIDQSDYEIKHSTSNSYMPEKLTQGSPSKSKNRNQKRNKKKKTETENY